MIFDRLKYSKLKFQSLQRFYVVKSREIINERSQNDGEDFRDIQKILISILVKKSLKKTRNTVVVADELTSLSLVIMYPVNIFQKYGKL